MSRRLHALALSLCASRTDLAVDAASHYEQAGNRITVPQNRNRSNLGTDRGVIQLESGGKGGSRVQDGCGGSVPGCPAVSSFVLNGIGNNSAVRVTQN